MNAPATVPALPGLSKLREPFPANQISKLPKESKAQADQRKANREVAVNCKVCGGWHHKNAVHLDYVGHAALTDRLLDTDPEWSWEPLTYTDDGLPAFDRTNGLWIKLTVCGVTRLGYGSADGKTGGDAIKEIIGDALRNAAMRFGAALDLWHKGDLHADDDATENTPAKLLRAPASEMPDAEWAKLVSLIKATGVKTGGLLRKYGVENLRHLSQDDYAHAINGLTGILAKKAAEATNAKAAQAQPEKSSAAATGEFAEIDAAVVPF